MNPTGRKIVLGLIGGVGSGKSTVARQLEGLGAVVVSGDEAGHRVLRREDVKREARSRWGQEIFGPDGEIDRKKLAAIVFAPTDAGREERRFLERLVHPLIEAALRGRIEELQRDPAVPLVVVDAAVLLEAGWDRVVDRILFVDAARPIRLGRVRSSRNWNERDLDIREKAQIPLTLKRQRAEYVVDNSGSPEETLAQVGRIFSTLTESRPA